MNFHLVVYIAGNSYAQQLISLADYAAQRRKHMKRRFRFSLKEQVQIITVEHEHFAIH